jgi:hypothetical protein
MFSLDVMGQSLVRVDENIKKMGELAKGEVRDRIP